MANGLKKISVDSVMTKKRRRLGKLDKRDPVLTVMRL